MDRVGPRTLTALVLIGVLPLSFVVHALRAHVVTRGLLIDAPTRPFPASHVLLGLTIFLAISAGGFLIWRAAVPPARAAEVVTDDVTGLHDRRFFPLRLEEEMVRCRRAGHPLSVAILGLDEFPGYPVGDETLRDVARILLESSRTVDVICRYDTREFAVLLPETTADGARAYAEGVVGAFTASSWSHGRQVTVSVGASSFPEGAGTKDDLVRGAEEALHAARQAGNNRVGVWAGPGVGRCAEIGVPVT